MILGQPNAERKYPAQGTPNLAFETASLSEEVCPNKHTPVNSKENATKLELIGHERKPTSLNFLSSARNGSITMSQDFRKFFRRPSNFPNSHRMSAMPESMQKRPAPNHGNQGRSRSTSSCDYSQDTETTSLSLTWPMSRSQHDVSNQVYRSVSNLLANDPSAESQYFGMSVEPTTTAPDLRQLQGSNSSGTADKENDSSTLSPTLTEQMTGAWTNSSAEEWLRMVDTEDMLRRLKRMRIISLTAKQWKIKRRPDGTRYLACRKSHETKCGPNPASKHDPTGNQKTSPQEDACQVQTNQQTERDSLENVNGNQRSLLEQPQSRRCKQKRSKCQSPNEISPRLSINTDQNVILNMNGTHSARRQSRKRDSVKLTSIVHRDDEDVTAAVNRPRLSVHEDRHRRASSQTIFNVRQTNTSTQRSYTAGRLSMMRNSGLANPNHPNQVLRDIHLFSNCSTYTTRSSDSSATTGSTKLVTMLVV
ncbi:hypothetical protein CLF_105068 [Clonorchis sinensis]|uniref:Uncharacterized protein n=1 Tax=Clonorchis sinensis TaxID=79923 RepID=G7YCX5_CLOSI|nr:hypothetical protein CLF_105068 [Clonorchis sinensis]